MKHYIFLGCLLLSGCASQPIAITDLIGQTQDDILSRFGTPTVIRSEAPNQLWAYREETCSRLIFFDHTQIVRWVDIIGTCPENNPQK